MAQEREVFPDNERFDPLTEKVISAYIQRYRHAGIGSLTEGIVHNLNGVLQILSMRTELLQRSLLGSEESDIPAVHQKVGQSFEQIQKMKTMVEGAGFRVERQRRLFRLLVGLMLPPVLTVARKPPVQDGRTAGRNW